LLGSVHIKANDTVTVLLSGCYVHVHFGQCWGNECTSLDFNWDFNLTFLQWERKGLDSDGASIQWELALDVSLGIAAARCELGTKRTDRC